MPKPQRAWWQRHTAILGVCLLLGGSPVLAAEAVTPESSPSPEAVATPTPTPIVGPQGPVGPQGSVGPTAPVGPQAPVGPAGWVAPTPTPSPSTSTVAGTSTEQSTAAAAAGTGGASNTDTGTNSANQNTQTTSTSVSNTNTNTATFNNTVDANANSGNNTVNSNSDVGIVKTGSVNGSVNIINVGNSVLDPDSTIALQGVNAGSNATISLTPSANRTALTSLQGETGASNSGTGTSSLNQNMLQNSNVVEVVRLDDALANNQVSIIANTGNNNLISNSDVAGLQTGDINLAVNILNLLNLLMPNLDLDIDVWSILTQNPNSTIVAGNNGTGANSVNTNKVTQNTTADIDINRNAIEDNLINVQASTGGNNISGNSDTGTLSTGTTNVTGNVVSIANASEPTFYLVNVMGEWNGVLQGVPSNSFVVNRLDNTDTGTGSQNTNTASNTTTLNGTVNQNAQATNNLLINANTGGNNLIGNSDVGDVKTGSINVIANIINILNSWTGSLDHFHLGIINIFGKAGPVAATAGATAEMGGVGGAAMPEDVLVGTNSNGSVSPTIVVDPSGGVGGGAAGPTKSVKMTPVPFILAQADTAGSAADQISVQLASASLSDPGLAKAAPTLQEVISQEQAASQSGGGLSSLPFLLGGAAGLLWLLTELAALVARRRFP